MYFDLNLPVPSSSKLTPAQVTVIDSRIDVLVQLGYTTIALNYVLQGKFDPKTHPSNRLDELLKKLKIRDGIIILKRLTIVLDESSEKGFGLTQQHQSHFSGYDILALAPTTLPSLSLACLTHTNPSPLTAHIITLPTDLPKQLKLKHTLVKAAIRNGAMFEINYAGALSVDEGVRRNWWGCAREAARACVKNSGGLVVSGGCESAESLRGARDVANLISLLGLAQDQALNTVSKSPRSIVIRAQTRKTYRAILSEPRIVYPTNTDIPAEATTVPQQAAEQGHIAPQPEVSISTPSDGSHPQAQVHLPTSTEDTSPVPPSTNAPAASIITNPPMQTPSPLKRPRAPSPTEEVSSAPSGPKKKKKRKGKGGSASGSAITTNSAQ